MRLAVWPRADNRGLFPGRNGAYIVRENERVARVVGKAGKYLRIEVVGMMVARENAQALIAVYLRQLALGIVKKTDNILPFRKKRAVPDVCNAHGAASFMIYISENSVFYVNQVYGPQGARASYSFDFFLSVSANVGSEH